MGLLTGIPLGPITAQEDLYFEGAPYLYYQAYGATPLNNPDTQSYYWGLSGTATNPVYALGCVQNISLSENLTVNAVRCDTVGDKDVIQRRNHLELDLTIVSLFPLTMLAPILNASTPTVANHREEMGMGAINNNLAYIMYMPKVYDPVTGDLVIFHLHKAKFVDAWKIEMKGGEPWLVSGLKVWAFADDTKPANQTFCTVIRQDPSVV